MGLREAVMEGALLRLRPKMMTVSTVVAGLLPIMRSTRTGGEVMKPLATPVVGGMVSSPLHVLIVTPVIFTWLRERELSRTEIAPQHKKELLDIVVTTPDNAGSRQNGGSEGLEPAAPCLTSRHSNDEAPSPKIRLLPVSAHAQGTSFHRVGLTTSHFSCFSQQDRGLGSWVLHFCSDTVTYLE
ncbi:MAG: efflux RND transporter permease subunit [Terriglobales bacterium]